MTIKAIIFDFGDVLNKPPDLDKARAHREKLAAKLRLPVDQLWPYLFESEAARQWMTGQISWNQFWTMILAPRGISDPDEIAAFANEVFAGTERLNPEMVDLLGQVKPRLKLAIVSNASWTEEELERRLYGELGLPKGFFDTVITSTSAGVAKPNPEIFRLALARLGVEPDEAIFTDDLSSFTASAARLGLHTHTFTTPADFRDYLVRKGILAE